MYEKVWNITAAGREAEIDIFGVIGDFGGLEESAIATDFMRDLRSFGKVTRLNINIHSPGGSMWDGMAMYRAIRDFQGEKIVNVPALAASAATFPMLAGDVINIGAEAEVMIHNPMLMAFADSEASANAVPVRWKQARENILNIYEKRTGQKREHLMDLMATETWFLGEEAVAAGFADKVMKDTARVRIAAMAIPESISCHWKNKPKHAHKPQPLPPELEARAKKLGVI